MIKPTPGRVVWFRTTNPGAMSYPDNGDALAAIVTRVWGDRMVNLVVFDANGVSHPKTSVALLQDDDTPGGNSIWCEWMPYQKGQAAKHESAAS